jgi:tetrapyrrole methylase family protein/MazG family protein
MGRGGAANRDAGHPGDVSLPLVTIVGLGPGGDEHVTAETVAALAACPSRFLRTSRHPSAHLATDLPGGADALDHFYEAADTFDDVYAAIVEHLVAAAVDHAAIVYAVPGSPLVLERTVRELRRDGRVECRLLPAMSFLDVAWARLGIDPVEEGVRLVDGHDFARAARGERGPLLVAHTHANWVLSDIKLAVEEASGDEPVVVLQRLGTPDEAVVETTWSELDRTVEADHLTTIYVPRLAAPIGDHYVRFHELTRTLRERCPWDREQTHQSLAPYLIEEAFELVDALQAQSDDEPASDTDVIEELGDLLYHIEFHAAIAEEAGRFSIVDITDNVHDKLVRRHPHVFGEVDADDPATVEANWEQIKRAEKQRDSLFDGVATSQPALAYAQQLGRKVAKVGFDWDGPDHAMTDVDDELTELREARQSGDEAAIADEFGDVLFALVNVARHLDVDAELALRGSAGKFRRRFEAIEVLAAERGIDVHTAGLAALDALWDEVKATERTGSATI